MRLHPPTEISSERNPDELLGGLSDPDDCEDLPNGFDEPSAQDSVPIDRDEEDEAGRALLSDAASPGVQAVAAVRDVPSPTRSGLDALAENVFDDSFGRSTPPNGPTLRPTARQPGRISFKDSVRISSGLRTSSHRHRPPNALTPATESADAFAAVTKFVGTAPSDLLVQAVTPSLSASTSRATSPFRRDSRRPSHSSGSFRDTAGLLHVGSYPYSSSPTSFGGASRSSSPCSSIYAPLQPPSRHCPNPMMVRQQGAPLRRTRSSQSFQEFLRKNRQQTSDDGQSGHDSDEDSDAKVEDDMDEADGADAPRRLEYHDLVEEQRAKKARWEARRRLRAAQKRQEALRDAPSLWSRLGALFLYGHPDGAVRLGGPSTTPAALPPLSAMPDRLSHASFDNSPARSSPLAQATSQSSLSSVSTIRDSDSESDFGAPTVDSNGKTNAHSTSAVKTESDVRFGPAPARYLKASWWRAQFRRICRALAKFWKTASAGWQASRRRRERAVGYGTV